ncbi:(2Fe-2S)-binding protein [Virgibacillus soli]|uniref:(2Fe-2S)-binding protein n=1 Tax=Paracerasibacillus soli TaxID=480284 RepID=A0ABU5CQI7_9BACI|nr:(2Fe-2S)-binding protein [Virgibacillus soli]MDY0407708.1 (2Fe-2S)-binding protein [Virgibacillus soli]
MDVSKTGGLVKLKINGQTKEVSIRFADTLLFTLREQLGLMGAKPSCHNGDCGACTILIDEIPFNACHLLTAEVIGKNITTIEGLKDITVQEAFIKHWALQCGYCTPGFILNTYALVKSKPNATDKEIDEWLDSNICRCTGYQEIKAAVKSVLQSGVSS